VLRATPAYSKSSPVLFKMKTLNETFTEKEFSELRRAKYKLKNGNSLSWRTYLLKTARRINNENN